MDNELTRLGNAESSIKENPEAGLQDENTATEKSGTGKKAAATAAAGLAVGVAATALTAADIADESDIVYIDIDDDGDLIERHGSKEAPMSDAVDEEMTFGEAFAAARADVGPGGTFLWHGGVYGTFDAQEWNEMTPAEQVDWQNSIQWHEVLDYQNDYVNEMPEPVGTPIEVDPEDPEEPTETEPDKNDDEDDICVVPADDDEIGEPNIPDPADGIDDLDYTDTDIHIDDTIYNDI